jgi:nodulation protein E
MSLGEGAAVFVLETLKIAQARGATPLCELAGYGPPVTPLIRCAQMSRGQRGDAACAASADVEPSQVNYLNAHGTATYANDITEF